MNSSEPEQGIPYTYAELGLPAPAAVAMTTYLLYIEYASSCVDCDAHPTDFEVLDLPSDADAVEHVEKTVRESGCYAREIRLFRVAGEVGVSDVWRRQQAEWTRRNESADRRQYEAMKARFEGKVE